MNKELIRDRDELRKQYENVERMAKDVDWSDMDAIARFQESKQPFYDKVKLFEEKYKDVFYKFPDDLVEYLSAGIRENNRIAELLRADGASLDCGTMRLSFKVVVENGGDVVVGGELNCRDKDGIMAVRIREDEVYVEPVDEFQFGCRAMYKISAEDPFRTALVEYFRDEWVRLH